LFSRSIAQPAGADAGKISAKTGDERDRHRA
jgi:hypothetical protein